MKNGKSTGNYPLFECTNVEGGVKCHLYVSGDAPGVNVYFKGGEYIKKARNFFESVFDEKSSFYNGPLPICYGLCREPAFSNKKGR